MAVSLTGMQSYWKLDEASGARADSHGANTLTDNNTVLSATGIINSAADFERSNSEYLSATSNASLQNGNNDWTFSWWFRFESVNNSSMVTKDALGFRDYTNDATAAGSLRTYILGGGVNPQAIVNVSGGWLTSTWYFAISWHDSVADTLNLQLNNGTVSSVATGGVFPVGTAAQFRIGAREYTGFEDYMDGLIDETGYWKRVLTAGERSELWNGGVGLAYPFSGGVPVRVDRIGLLGVS